MKVPEPRKLSSGTYFIQLRLDGVSVPVTALTPADCKVKAELIKAQHRAGKGTVKRTKSVLTLDSILSRYISKYERTLSPSTIRGYEIIRKNRFKKYSNKSLKTIKDWQKVIDDELADVSEKTVKNAWGFVSVAMKDAGLAVPSVKLAKCPVRDMSFLEPDEIKLFLEAAKGDKAEVEMLLELHGLRESECMYVVRNNGIDLKRNVIHVLGSIVPDKDHKFVQKETNKNYSSTRTVPIMIPRLAELVQQYQESGEEIPCHSASALLSHVHKTCARASVTDVGNHGLRRSFASLLFSLSVPSKQIQEWGGWSDSQTMNKIYIKLISKDKDRNKNTVTQFFSQNQTTVID